MKLYIKRDKTVNNSLFIVFDQFCNEKYFVTGSKDKLCVSDVFGNHCLNIYRMPLPKIKVFSISAGKNNIKFFVNTSKENSCYFYGIGWRIRGNIFTKSFDIVDAENYVVATHGKDFSKCSDGYGLTVNNEDMELFCLATALCVNLESKVDKTLLQTV